LQFGIGRKDEVKRPPTPQLSKNNQGAGFTRAKMEEALALNEFIDDAVGFIGEHYCDDEAREEIGYTDLIDLYEEEYDEEGYDVSSFAQGVAKVFGLVRIDFYTQRHSPPTI